MQLEQQLNAAIIIWRSVPTSSDVVVSVMMLSMPIPKFPYQKKLGHPNSWKGGLRISEFFQTKTVFFLLIPPIIDKVCASKTFSGLWGGNQAFFRTRLALCSLWSEFRNIFQPPFALPTTLPVTQNFSQFPTPKSILLPSHKALPITAWFWCEESHKSQILGVVRFLTEGSSTHSPGMYP